MEDKLDDIAEGTETREELLKEFYQPFASSLEFADKEIGHVELPVEVSDVQCENCGRYMVIKQGRYGKFLACPGFPECRNAKPIFKEIGVACPKCNGQIVERRTKRGKTFYGCQKYPECDFMTWDTPLKENCQTCGSFMVRQNFKNGRFVTMCGNEACITRVNEEKKKEVEKKKPKKKAASKKTAKTKPKKKEVKKSI